MKYKKLLALLIIVCFHTQMFSQTSGRPKPGTVTKVAKFKPPSVKTYLGKNADTTQVLLDEATQLVGLPLKVTDAKNNDYTISSYQFLYKKKSVVENEQTGKKEIAFTTVSDLFKVTPLPDLWKSTIAGSLQKDEELYFFDVIVQDKLNRRFFAPELKIKIR